MNRKYELQWRACEGLQTFSTRYKGRSVFVTVAENTIEATYRHPFFVVRGKNLEARPRFEHLAEIPGNATQVGRWVDAGDLCVGDEWMAARVVYLCITPTVRPR